MSQKKAESVASGRGHIGRGGGQGGGVYGEQQNGWIDTVRCVCVKGCPGTIVHLCYASNISAKPNISLISTCRPLLYWSVNHSQLLLSGRRSPAKCTAFYQALISESLDQICYDWIFIFGLILDQHPATILDQDNPVRVHA